MKTERETKEKLIASAGKEFLEKGYAKASLRKICANAGVTTGALYFFFNGKEDLFRAIVEPPFNALVDIIRAHFAEEEQLLSLPESVKEAEVTQKVLESDLFHTAVCAVSANQPIESYNDSIWLAAPLKNGRSMTGSVHQKGDHDEITEQLIHHLYQNYDAFLLLLTKSQGTAFEGSLEQIVAMTEKQFAISSRLLAVQKSGRQPGPSLLHWMAHMMVDAFTHLLVHEKEEAVAVEQMKIIMDFIVNGFIEMILSPAKA